MNILHICSDFCGSRVHSHLYSKLDTFGIAQTVFTIPKKESLIGANKFDGKNTKFVYSFCLKWYHSYLYHLKQHTVYKKLVSEVDLNEVHVVHATTMFTDGAIAYNIYKEYGIPYIVAVRAADVYYFMKLAPHTWRTGRKVLLNASKIIFISQALQNHFMSQKAIRKILPDIKNKFMLIPNGIDDYWLDNTSKTLNKSHNIIYVGTFIERKNLENLMKGVILLKVDFPDIHLDIVGGGGEIKYQDKIQNLLDESPELFRFWGIIKEKKELRNIYLSNSIFALPSVRETFGLVYFEALSQNLAIIYTENDGIDGLVQEEVGERVSEPTPENIAKAIRKVMESRENYTSSIDLKKLRWSNVAERYISIYKGLMTD